MQINLKNDDTTASSGQSSNSQMNKLGKPKETRKLSKVRSRHFTADKRSRMKQNEDDENREENKSMIEEEKKLWNNNNAFREEIREYKPSQKDNSYFFSEIEKDAEGEDQEDEDDDEYAEEVEDPDNQNIQDQSNCFDQDINEDDEDDELTRELKVS